MVLKHVGVAARVIACPEDSVLRSWAAELSLAPHPKGNSKKIVYFPPLCPVCRKGRPSIRARGKDERAEKALVKVLRLVAPPEPFTTPVGLACTFLVQRPKAKAKRTAVWPCSNKSSAGTIPDLGNMEKLLEDALEKSGWIVNDSLICEHKTKKVYGDVAGYQVLLYELSQEDA